MNNYRLWQSRYCVVYAWLTQVLSLPSGYTVRVCVRYCLTRCSPLALFAYIFWPISFGLYPLAGNRSKLDQAVKLSSVGILLHAVVPGRLRQP